MATINDLSPKPKNVAISGNAVFASGQGKFGPTSLFFPTAGSFLYLDNNNDFNLSGNEYTIECWIKPSGAYSNNNTLITKRSEISGCSWELYLKNGNGRLGFYNGLNYESATTPVSNLWSHVAAVYNSGVLRLYLNGTGILTSNITNININAPVYIGNYPPLNQQYKGYIDDLRITKGVSGARYLANFSLPTAPFPITGTPISPPTSPLNPVAIVDDSTMSLSWSPPLDDNGADISDYLIQYFYDDNITYMQTNSIDSFYTLTNLTEGLTYKASIAALNMAGTGSYSVVVSGTLEFANSLMSIDGANLVTINQENLTYIY